MRPSIQNSRNSNASARDINGDNSRIVPGLESTAFKRGNRKLSQQQQISGNQIMLQRQKRRTVTSKLQKQQYQQQERQNQQQQEQQQSAKQEQENLGDYTMDRSKFSQQRDGNADIDIMYVYLCYDVLILHLRIHYNLLLTTYEQS